MDEMNPQDLKKLFNSRIDLGSTDLVAVAKSFTNLYSDFQSAIVNEVRIEALAEKSYTWVDPPAGRSRSVILFFHGGGYTMGSTADHMQLVANLAIQTGISVLGVDGFLLSIPFPLHWMMRRCHTAGCWNKVSQRRRLDGLEYRLAPQ